MTFPWLQPAVQAAPDPTNGFRFQVQCAQDEEMQRLRLENEFLRSETTRAGRGESILLVKVAGAGGSA